MVRLRRINLRSQDLISRALNWKAERQTNPSARGFKMKRLSQEGCDLTVGKLRKVGALNFYGDEGGGGGQTKIDGLAILRPI